MQAGCRDTPCNRLLVPKLAPPYGSPPCSLISYVLLLIFIARYRLNEVIYSRYCRSSTSASCYPPHVFILLNFHRFRIKSLVQYLPMSQLNQFLIFLIFLIINIVSKYSFYIPLSVLLLLRPLFLLIIKVDAFKRQIKDYCNKVVRALVLYFIKIFINLLDSYFNA